LIKKKGVGNQVNLSKLLKGKQRGSRTEKNSKGETEGDKNIDMQTEEGSERGRKKEKKKRRNKKSRGEIKLPSHGENKRVTGGENGE